MANEEILAPAVLRRQNRKYQPLGGCFTRGRPLNLYWPEFTGGAGGTVLLPAFISILAGFAGI